MINLLQCSMAVRLHTGLGLTLAGCYCAMRRRSTKERGQGKEKAWPGADADAVGKDGSDVPPGKGTLDSASSELSFQLPASWCPTCTPALIKAQPVPLGVFVFVPPADRSAVQATLLSSIPCQVGMCKCRCPPCCKVAMMLRTTFVSA